MSVIKLKGNISSYFFEFSLDPWNAENKIEASRGKSILRNLWKYLSEIRNLVRLSQQKSLWNMRTLLRLMLKRLTPLKNSFWNLFTNFDEWHAPSREQLILIFYFIFSYEFIALGVDDGQNEQLEYIAKKNKRYTRIPTFASLNTAKMTDNIKFWLCNPDKRESQTNKDLRWSGVLCTTFKMHLNIMMII